MCGPLSCLTIYQRAPPPLLPPQSLSLPPCWDAPCRLQPPRGGPSWWSGSWWRCCWLSRCVMMMRRMVTAEETHTRPPTGGLQACLCGCD